MSKKAKKAPKASKKPASKAKAAKPAAKKVNAKAKAAPKSTAKKLIAAVKKKLLPAAKKSAAPAKAAKGGKAAKEQPKKLAAAKNEKLKKTAAPATGKAAPKTEADKKAAMIKNLKAEGKEAAMNKKVEPKAPVKDVILTDAEGRQLCRVKDCDQLAAVEAYCRYHYLFFWKKIQNRKKILSEGKLEQYIEELTSRYPLKFIELIRKDLSSEPDFLSAIQELDIDEASNIDEFEDENFIDEVRGMGATDTERVDDEY